ncbi:DUF4300 family protein [Peptoniphilus sp. GNH]|nr:DUF4300 family protein [Peptoniphilus sp. GNH]
MKKISLLIILTLFLFACKKFEAKFSNLGDEGVQGELEELFKANKIDNFDVIINNLKNFNSTNEEAIVKGWEDLKMGPTDPYKYNEDYSEKSSKLNCREVAALGILNSIDIKEADVKGSYLMFDKEDLETCAELKNVNKRKFYALFNEIEVPDTIKDPKAVKEYLQEALDKKNIVYKNGQVKLMLAYLHDKDSKSLFVGHAGLLFKKGKDYYFFEKLSSYEPYQLSKVRGEDEVAELFLSRYDLNDELGKPYVTVNGIVK